MGADRHSWQEIRCAVLWRLARTHGWAHWLPEERLVRAVPSHERGRAKRTIEELVDDTLVRLDPARGLRLRHDRIDDLAAELRDRCGFSEFRIEATRSHFGGFR